MITSNQVFVIVDIEADGPMPGLYSMLSLGAVATTPEKEVSRFYRKLKPIEGATQYPDTMRWWKTQPEAWNEVCTDAESPEIVMREFCDWLHSLNAELVFAASPIALDYSFVGWYLYRFAGENPFSNENNAARTLDIRSFIAGKYDTSFNNSSRTKLPKSLIDGMIEHTHKSIDDADGYAFLLRKIINDHSHTL